jgi:RNA polymerase subunit RPABC4/transcription elongation factor Spt4
MTKVQTEAKTDARTNTEPRQCPFCSETVNIDAKTCRYCGHDFLVLTPSVLGWVTVAEYAEATSKSEEEIMSAIRDGAMDGQLVCGTWMVQFE